GEVDEGTTQMDWMPQERERGITITAAATSVAWHDCRINIIDTPGHVDFTMEVERSLKVLDGAVIVLCGVGGVEPQSETVWRQADRYQVPRVAFINKLDRAGSDFDRVIRMMEERLTMKPVPVQLPIGEENRFQGIVDIVLEQGFIWRSDDLAASPEQIPIPQHLEPKAAALRHRLIDILTTVDEKLLEKYLADIPLSPADLQSALRRGTLERRIVPVLCGSALRNKGIQKLLDAIVAYLPSPCDIPPARGVNPKTGEPELRPADSTAPFSGLVFKLQSDAQRGMLSYIRVYSGRLKPGDVVMSIPAMKRVRVPKLAVMHANRLTEVDSLSAGEIGAIVGLKDSRTGITLADLHHPVAFEAMRFPEPVVSLAIEPKTRADAERLQQTLEMLSLEDPTFRVKTDEETGQLILSGMGELHLEVLIDRMERDYRVAVHSGKPQVSYRETVRQSATAEHRFIRQTGGRGHYAVVKIGVEPAASNDIVDELPAGTLPRELAAAVTEALRESLETGVLAGYEIVNTCCRILDASWHDVDSSEVDFKLAASAAFREAFLAADPTFLEPIMELEVVTPEAYLGGVLADINARGGRVIALESAKGHQIVKAELALSRSFGYATALRSLTQGRASHSLQFRSFLPVDEATRVRLYPLFAKNQERSA
ncbi:MAG: elongation factor G, partial [candidate division WOR-3 bacterium]